MGRDWRPGRARHQLQDRGRAGGVGTRHAGDAHPWSVASRQAARPSVALLLDVDREYRRRARLGGLRLVSPRRFNPANEAWLPVMRSEREGWKLEALFSNTRRANELGRTRDWVVIYYRRGRVEGQCTVVTARRGRLLDLRVVRGRERECRRHYEERRVA